VEAGESCEYVDVCQNIAEDQGTIGFAPVSDMAGGVSGAIDHTELANFVSFNKPPRYRASGASEMAVSEFAQSRIRHTRREVAALNSISLTRTAP
jgi:hypothetical protein